MAERRIVVEHEDGRRVSIPEGDFARPEGNPFNMATDIHQFDANTGETIIRRRPARPLDDHVSLADEGFVQVAYIHGEACDDACRHDPDVVVHAGNEIALEAD